MVAPKVRKHLSADALFHVVRSGFATIPEPHCEDGDISLTDTLMSAFAMFSLKAPSLLAFDKERAEGNLQTIYGIQHVPCDTYMRERLDPVSPKWLRPVFKSVFRQLQRGKALEELVFLDGHYLLALDGTEYFSSKTIHCASCLHRVHRNGVCVAMERLWEAFHNMSYRVIIVMHRNAVIGADTVGFSPPITLHNYWPCNMAIKRSGTVNLPRRSAGGMIASRASSFSVGSART